MSRSRLIPLAVLASLVATMVATASASEPPKKCGGTVTKTPAYCVEGFQLETSTGEAASEKVEGNDGEAILKGTVASVTTEVKCAKGKSKGTIEDRTSAPFGKLTATITYTECQLVKPTNCQLGIASNNEIKTEPLAGELILNSGRIEDKLESTTSVFTAVDIEGKESSCVIAHVGEEKLFNITGSQTCAVDKTNAEAEKEAKEHKLICTSSGGLKLGTNPASMTGEGGVELSGTKAHGLWSVKEHV